ncbi:MAG: hypothetical protein V4635_16125 [Bacteroidota bacterium]
MKTGFFVLIFMKKRKYFPIWGIILEDEDQGYAGTGVLETPNLKAAIVSGKQFLP